MSKILVVEPSRMNRRVAQVWLEHLRWEVIPAGSAYEGLTLFNKAPEGFDAAFIEIESDKGLNSLDRTINGIELAKQLLDKQPDLLIVFTSIYDADALNFDGYKEYSNRHLTKPFKPADLVEALKVSESEVGTTA